MLITLYDFAKSSTGVVEVGKKAECPHFGAVVEVHVTRQKNHRQLINHR